jgi:hypothetical protein
MTEYLILAVFLKLSFVCGQFVYQLILKRETAELSDATWDACLLKGEK